VQVILLVALLSVAMYTSVQGKGTQSDNPGRTKLVKELTDLKCRFRFSIKSYHTIASYRKHLSCWTRYIPRRWSEARTLASF